MPTIDTLVKDMEDTILGLKGWDHIVGLKMGDSIAKTAFQRFSEPQKPRKYLSFSSIGSPCQRKLWYKINDTEAAKPLSAADLLKFFYGDMIEELVLSIVKVSGHEVTGEQDRMYIGSMAGHRDAVIDGMTVDVNAAKDDPLVTNKTHGAFLVVDKVNGTICLDVYDFSKELEQKEKEIKTAKKMVKGKIPDRPFKPVPVSESSPNTKLPKTCTFCDFKKKCWPEARKFVYSNYDSYLIDVVKKPNVPEDLTYNEQKEV